MEDEDVCEYCGREFREGVYGFVERDEEQEDSD